MAKTTETKPRTPKAPRRYLIAQLGPLVFYVLDTKTVTAGDLWTTVQQCKSERTARQLRNALERAAAEG